MKTNWKALIICILIPLGVGFLSGFITGDSMESFNNFIKPPLSPPGWLFPVVWTILYILMGISSYLIYSSDSSKQQKHEALQIYALQLIVNFFWSILFFNFSLYYASFLWILLLIALIILLIYKAYPISNAAAKLLIPYLAWVTFAAYLNLGIALLN